MVGHTIYLLGYLSFSTFSFLLSGPFRGHTLDAIHAIVIVFVYNCHCLCVKTFILIMTMSLSESIRNNQKKTIDRFCDLSNHSVTKWQTSWS